MVRKSDLVSEMADQAAHRIAGNASSWKKYLDTKKVDGEIRKFIEIHIDNFRFDAYNNK